MFRFIVKIVNSKQIGRGDDSKKKAFVISHVQFVGVESLAAKYAYTLNIFEAKSRKRSQEFQGIVTSTLNSTIEECVKHSDNCGKCLLFFNRFFSNVSIFRDQSITSLKADLRQDINGGFAFSSCLNGTFP